MMNHSVGTKHILFINLSYKNHAKQLKVQNTINIGIIFINEKHLSTLIKTSIYNLSKIILQVYNMYS